MQIITSHILQICLRVCSFTFWEQTSWINANNVSGYFNYYPDTSAQPQSDEPCSEVITDNGIRYECSLCKHRYMHMKTLKRHQIWECQKIKHIVCYTCGYKTHRNDRLIAHIRVVHPENAAQLPTRNRLKGKLC